MRTDARPRCPKCGEGKAVLLRLNGPDIYSCGHHIDFLAEIRIAPYAAMAAEAERDALAAWLGEQRRKERA